MPIATLGIDDAARNAGRFLGALGGTVAVTARLTASRKAVKAMAKLAVQVAAAQGITVAIEAGAYQLENPRSDRSRRFERRP